MTLVCHCALWIALGLRPNKVLSVYHMLVFWFLSLRIMEDTCCLGPPVPSPSSPLMSHQLSDATTLFVVSWTPAVCLTGTGISISGTSNLSGQKFLSLDRSKTVPDERTHTTLRTGSRFSVLIPEKNFLDASARHTKRWYQAGF